MFFMSEKVFYRSFTPSFRNCIACDILRKILHLVMQWPRFEIIHTQMYRDLYYVDDRLITIFRECPADTFNRLIGKNTDCIENKTMYGNCIWLYNWYNVSYSIQR